MPTVALPPTTLSTVQVTSVLLNPWMVALNCSVPDGATVADVGEVDIVKTAREALSLTPVLASATPTV